jgi:hypothetical protein
VAVMTRWFLLFLPSLCVFSSVLSAQIVKEVGTDGTLTLEDGKQVVPVGVQMDSEGISILRVLVRKQDVKLQLIASAVPGAKEFAYIYLQAKYLKFPAKLNAIPDEQEVLINEFLVKIGAAKVSETQDFSRKTKFLKVQDEAKKKGEGIWSYEVS